MVKKQFRTKENYKTIAKGFRQVSFNDDPWGMVIGMFLYLFCQILFVVLSFFILVFFCLGLYLIKGGSLNMWDGIFNYIQDLFYLIVHPFYNFNHKFTYDTSQIVLTTILIILSPIIRVGIHYIFKTKHLGIIEMPQTAYQKLIQKLNPDQIIIVNHICNSNGAKSYGWSMIYGDIRQVLSDYNKSWEAIEKQELKKNNEKALMAMDEQQKLAMNTKNLAPTKIKLL